MMKNDKRHINLEEDKHLKGNPFGVEKDYFKSLTENILNGAKASESELEFNLHLKQNKMEVPAGYFDSLASKIEAKIDAESQIEETATQVISINKSNRFRWVGIAASLLLIASIYFGVSFNGNSQDELAEVSDELLIEFLDTNAEFSDEMMADISDLDLILDEIYIDETSNMAGIFGDNPELEYDFDYYE